MALLLFCPQDPWPHRSSRCGDHSLDVYLRKLWFILRSVLDLTVLCSDFIKLRWKKYIQRDYEDYISPHMELGDLHSYTCWKLPRNYKTTAQGVANSIWSSVKASHCSHTGAESIGKTTFLRKAMLDWASGDLWKKRFQYVFFFSLVSLNSTTELSRTQLLLSQLSASSETLDDVLSDPRKILFILDGFDYLKFDLELQTNLCDDWRKTLLTQIVLSSLLQKVMLQESSLLLELGNPSIPKICPLL